MAAEQSSKEKALVGNGRTLGAFPLVLSSLERENRALKRENERLKRDSLRLAKYKKVLNNAMSRLYNEDYTMYNGKFYWKDF